MIVSHRFGVAESLSECVGYSYSVVVALTEPTCGTSAISGRTRAEPRCANQSHRGDPDAGSGARYDTMQAGIRDEVGIRLAVAAAAQKKGLRAVVAGGGGPKREWECLRGIGAVAHRGG